MGGGLWRQSYQQAPVTMVLITITVAAWLLHVALLWATGINTDLSLGGIGTLGAGGQWWRLLTPVVVHFGIVHLSFNMVWLYELGPPVERIMGRVRFTLTYLGTAIAGNVCSDLVYYHQQPPVLAGGASGAIYGLGGVLVGAYAVAKLLARLEPDAPVRNGMLVFNDKMVRSLALLFGVYLILGNLIHVDTAAHFGGGVLGLLIGAALAWSRNHPHPAVR